MFESEYGFARQKDAEPPPAFSMTLSRGLTNAAFVEYLEADERMAPLAVCLVDDTVLGDTLIDAIMQFKSGMVSS